MAVRPALCAALALVAVLGLISPSAGAVTLRPTDDALTGSLFQGGNGTQVATRAGLLDWEDLDRQGRVTHAQDPNDEDDAFAHGSKDYNPAGWDLKIARGGVTPGGTNVRDAWTSVDQTAGTTFLYLGATRASDTGTSFVTFELNRDNRLWDNGKALIPCRRTGDLQITYLPHGNTQTVLVRQWVTKTADAATGCARTGTVADVALVPNVDVQGAFNDERIPSVLGGAVNPISARLFSEAAIDLKSVLQSTTGTPCGAFASFWIYSHASDSVTSNMDDIVRPRPLDVRTCAAAGTKFLDENADGVRQQDEPGLEGFRIFADYDGDGVQDSDEPFTYTDAQGNYVLDDIQRSAYTLREATPTGTNAEGWRCSLPNASITAPPGAVADAPGGMFRCGWNVDRAAEAFARGRDFGDWRPARLTLEKRVFPTGDTTTFTLHHPGAPGSPFTVGDGDAVGGDLPLDPGTYTVSEDADPAYQTHVTCSIDGRPVSSVAGVTTSITLRAGDDAVCRFSNARTGAPGVSVVKEGPQSVTAGETIHYRLNVVNVGAVSFAEDDVRVTDAGCSTPRRVDRDQDPTPASLDPGETWVFACSRPTAPAGEDCVDRHLTNTGHVTAGDVTDSDSVTTAVGCPQPAIALQKLGEATAVAGSVVRYVFFVYNVGDTTFRDEVTVADANCDDAPVVGRKLDETRSDDPTPATFDPGDIWVFACVATLPSSPGAGACEPFTVTNTATAQATTDTLGATTRDTFATDVTCPPVPLPPQPEPEPQPLPLPDTIVVPPAPVAEAVSALGEIVTPEAGTAGTAARVRVRATVRGCLRRGSAVTVRVARAASVALFVRGRRVTGVHVRPLQSRVVVRLLVQPPPGPFTVRVTIHFQRGADTKPLSLTRRVRGCAAAVPPAVTG